MCSKIKIYKIQRLVKETFEVKSTTAKAALELKLENPIETIARKPRIVSIVDSSVTDSVVA